MVLIAIPITANPLTPSEADVHCSGSRFFPSRSDATLGFTFRGTGSTGFACVQPLNHDLTEE